MFTLGNLIVAVVIGVVAGLIKFPLLVSLYGLAVLVPGLAVCVRRLHDIGKSGWWVLIGLVPVIGGIWLLVLMCPSTVSRKRISGVRIPRHNPL